LKLGRRLTTFVARDPRDTVPSP